jgi:inosine/xanthosine triphosphatase
MPTIIVASTNPVKINATKSAFDQMFPGREHVVEGLSAPSNVPDQPMGTEETILGARNRLNHIRQQRAEADYWVGIEGGLITDEHDNLVSEAWFVIADRGGRESKSSTATFVLPKVMAELIRGGLEMGHATDKLFGMVDSKTKNSSVGVLTDDIINRTSYYSHALVLALIPFKHPHLY